MSATFLIFTVLLIIVSVAMVLIILVQRPQGGGLAGAFGGAGGGAGTESVFGGRVGDALTWSTVVAFLLYLSVAVTLNLIDSTDPAPVADAGPGAVGTGATGPGEDGQRQMQRIDPSEGQPQITPDIQIEGGDDADVQQVDPQEVPAEVLEQFQRDLEQGDTPTSSPPDGSPE